MEKLRAHHLKHVLKTIERAFLSKKWSKDETTPLEVLIDQEISSKYQREVDNYRKTLKRGSEYPDEVQDVVQYIGPQGENEERYLNMSIEYFASLCKFIINGEGTLRIQTDPTTACEACWLSNNRKFGLHCIPNLDGNENERDHHFPLENNDVFHLEVLSNLLSIPITEELGVTNGVVNKFLDIHVEVLRELLIKDGEFNSKIIIEIADQLRDCYEGIGMMEFDWIFYVYNQRA